jgi:hypothetical protein
MLLIFIESHRGFLRIGNRKFQGIFQPRVSEDFGKEMLGRIEARRGPTRYGVESLEGAEVKAERLASQTGSVSPSAMELQIGANTGAIVYI